MKDDLERLFSYNKDSGEFYYLHNSRGHRAGAKAGTILNNGYVQLWVNGKKYLGHRIAWMMSYDSVPEHIDHIDGDRANNRLSNLRAATPRENQQNRIEHRRGERLVGAHYTATMRHKPWRGIIRVRGRNRHLGYFESEAEAHRAYMTACARLANG